MNNPDFETKAKELRRALLWIHDPNALADDLPKNALAEREIRRALIDAFNEGVHMLRRVAQLESSVRELEKRGLGDPDYDSSGQLPEDLEEEVSNWRAVQQEARVRITSLLSTLNLEGARAALQLLEKA